MQYVIAPFQVSTLRRGKSLEQFLGGGIRNGEPVIFWVELRPSLGGVEVWSFEAPDVGGPGFTDMYEFGADTESPLVTLSSPAEALQYAHTQLGANPERWVNVTLVEAEYASYVAAGRPMRT